MVQQGQSPHICNMKKRLIKFIRNKYVAAVAVFLGWICFFNEIDLAYIVETRIDLYHLSNEVEEMKVKTKETQQSLVDLTTNKQTLEKFARETYYMKKANEDVYVFKERAED